MVTTNIAGLPPGEVWKWLSKYIDIQENDHHHIKKSPFTVLRKKSLCTVIHSYFFWIVYSGFLLTTVNKHVSEYCTSDIMCPSIRPMVVWSVVHMIWIWAV